MEKTRSNHYDLIVIDQHMAEAHGKLLGHEVVRIMRANGIKSVIIGCSGNDVAEQHMHAGTTLMWSKPIPTSNKIVTQLSALLFDRELKMLVADDSTMNRRLLLRRLKTILPSKIVFAEAKSGEEAIARARETSFDVLVLDEHMGPGIKGTEVMRALRTAGCTAIMIGFSGANMASEHRDAGAVLSWSKPLPSDRKIRSDLCLALAVRRKLIVSGSHDSLIKVFERLQ